MRVRVSFTVDVSDEERRTIARTFGHDGLASRDEVAQWYASRLFEHPFDQRCASLGAVSTLDSGEGDADGD